MTAERLQILSLPEDKTILSVTLNDIDFQRLLESNGIKLDRQEDFEGGNQVITTQLSFDGHNMMPLSVVNRTRGMKAPSTTLIIPRRFYELDEAQQQVALAYTFLKNRGPINLNFESGTDNRTVTEAFGYMLEVRKSMGMILNDYARDLIRSARPKVIEIV